MPLQSLISILFFQVQLLKDSGLATLLGPKSAGGGGLKWSEAYQVIRRVARGDGSLAMILGYSYLWYWAAALVGTEEQRERIEKWLTEKKAIIGGAVNPRDSDLKVIPHPTDENKLIFDGKKTFSTGSKISDVTILEGTNDKGEHIFAAVESRQPGELKRELNSLFGFVNPLEKELVQSDYLLGSPENERGRRKLFDDEKQLSLFSSR